MFKRISCSVKYWMTLIELLIVITILWILIAVLVPKIGSTQAKTRDITRQTQVQELASALISYKLDFWEFPIITGEFQSWHSNVTSKTPYRWSVSLLNDTLKVWWYISKIPKDPSNFSIKYEKEEGWQYHKYENNGYYVYISDGKSFMIIAPMENENDGNCDVSWEILIEKTIWINSENYYNKFDGPSNNKDSWPTYIYKYKEEVL